jgi:hypothetical protein
MTNSARVFEAKWNKMPVAVKVLKAAEGVTPNIDVRTDAHTQWNYASHALIVADFQT